MRSEYDGPVLTDNGNSLTCLTKEHDEGFMLKVETLNAAETKLNKYMRRHFNTYRNGVHSIQMEAEEYVLVF